MTYNIGDPDHIGVHNTLASDVQAQADAYGVEVTLPPQRSLGDRQHVDDHNLLASALQAISEAEPPGDVQPIAAQVSYSSGAVSTYSYLGNGTNGAAAQLYDVYVWTGAGAFVIEEGNEGLVDLLLVGGGGGGAYSDGTVRCGGGGGGVLHVEETMIVPGSYQLYVGAGGAHRAHGGHTAVDAWTWSKAGGGSAATAGNSHYAWGVMNAGGGSGAAYDRSGGVTETYNGAGAGGELYNAGTHANHGDPRGRWISITGTNVEYGRGGPGKGNGATDPGCAGGGVSGNAGQDGLLVVRVRTDQASFPLQRSATPPTRRAAKIVEGVVRNIIVTPDVGAEEATVSQYVNGLQLEGRWVLGDDAAIGDHYIETKDGGHFMTPVIDDPTPPYKQEAGDE